MQKTPPKAGLGVASILCYSAAMDWTVIALITAALFVLYSIYEAAVAFRLVPHTRNGRSTGPTYSPGESIWLVLASLIYAGLWINALT